MDKPGRNDPCYCGSGKKYKQCHMKEDQAAEQEERAWADAARFLRRDLMSFARDERFAVSFAQALPYYWDGLYDATNAEEMSMSEALRFFDWFVFDYEPAEGPRLLEVYHIEKYNDLSNHQQQVLTNWLQAGASGAYELTSYDGQTLHLRDFFTGETCDVYEPSGHGNVQPGEVILARLVMVYNHFEFSTTAAYLPKDEIAGLREKMEAAKTADSTLSHADFMRRYNHLLVHHALEQAKQQGRPPVARLDVHRPDKLVQKVARTMKNKLGGKTFGGPTNEYKPQTQSTRKVGGG